MQFTIDKQTLADLQVAANATHNSIYQLFNHCQTQGGERLLMHVFENPLCCPEDIQVRTETIDYFFKNGSSYPLDTAGIGLMEKYVANTDERTRLKEERQVHRLLGNNLLGQDVETKLIQSGIQAVVDLFKVFRTYLTSLDVPLGHRFRKEYDRISSCLHHSDLKGIFETTEVLSANEFVRFDALLRFQHRELLLDVLKSVYWLDVYIAVAQVAKREGFNLPKLLPLTDGPLLRLKEVYHPLLKNAITNDVTMEAGKNMIFLTGANMAGKSTVMKAVSLSVLLAHMGFPVPAKEMKFTVLDGLYTTINLPDNLGIGASHFYAEVLRVKKVVQQLSEGKRLFVVFDEMFRGTNVKDAYEATVQICSGYIKYAESLFVISTHITEASTALNENTKNIDFLYLPTVMEGQVPRYTYKLESGVTGDRHGMVIIRQAGILEMLASGKH